jgi:photosystem II stability/assembly factor-like uncharacterized protein
MKTKLSLLLLLLLHSASLSLAQKNTQPNQSNSSVGVYLETVTHDGSGDLWVGGSVWLLQGLLLRINSAGVRVITPPKIKTVQRLLFTGRRVGWMIADYRSLYTSTDGGNNWRQVLTNPDSNLQDISFVGSSGWIVGWGGVIYHTDDGGKLWRKQTSGTDIDLNQVVFVDGLHGWAMGWNMLDMTTYTWPPVLLSTNDGGASWKSIGNGNLSLRSIAFVNTQDGWGVVVDKKDNWRLARTNNGGLTWEVSTSPTQSGWDYVLFLNQNAGWAVGDGIFHTNNGGQNWEPQQLPSKDLSFSRISFTGLRNGGAIHTMSMHTERPGDIVRTTDGGLYWRAVSNSWIRPTTDRVYREQFPGLRRSAKQTLQRRRGPTNRWTRAAGACFAT